MMDRTKVLDAELPFQGRVRNLSLYFVVVLSATTLFVSPSYANFTNFCVAHSKWFAKGELVCFQESMRQYVCRYDRRAQEYYWSYVQRLSLRSSLNSGSCDYAAPWGNQPNDATPIQ